jgi:4-carboxymuconolactone decarboxylase
LTKTAHKIVGRLAGLPEEVADAFGHEGLVDVVMLIGLYLTTCAIINAFEVPAPEEI